MNRTQFMKVFRLSLFVGAICTIGSLFFLIMNFANQALPPQLIKGFYILLMALYLLEVAKLCFKYKTPKFFIHYKRTGWVHLNRQAIDILTDKDVANLSKAEREFFKSYGGCKNARAEATLEKGKKISQEELCKRFLGVPVIEGGPINMAEVMAAKPSLGDQ